MTDRYGIADEYLDVYSTNFGRARGTMMPSFRIANVAFIPIPLKCVTSITRVRTATFKVAGPHPGSPSRQRTPVLFQATGSDAGKEFAARHAEVVFTGGMNADDQVRANIADMRARLLRHGRKSTDIKFITGAGIITGKTDAQVAAKLELFKKNMSVEGRLAHSFVAHRLHPISAHRTSCQHHRAEGYRL